jgi:hypothetical protein
MNGARSFVTVDRSHPTTSVDLLLLFIAFPGANGLSAQHFGAL